MTISFIFSYMLKEYKVVIIETTTDEESPKHLNENAYYKGIRDFIKGNITSPYTKDSIRDKEWQRGFNTQYFRNLDFIKKSEKHNFKYYYRKSK